MSVTRRRNHLVDLNLQVRPNVASYQFFAAANFDSAFTQFALVPAGGLRSVSVADVGMADGQFRGLTRFLFDPSDYTVAVAAVNDAKPFFLQVKQVGTDGVVGSAEAMHLVLPFSSMPNRPVVLQGNAPNGVALANSLEIQLPMQCTDWDIQNEGGSDMMVAFEANGPEFVVHPVAANSLVYRHTYSAVSQILVRGNGAITAFRATFTLRNNPTA